MGDSLSVLQHELSFIGCFSKRGKEWNYIFLSARSFSDCAYSNTIWLMQMCGSLWAVHFVNSPALKPLFQLSTWNGGGFFLLLCWVGGWPLFIFIGRARYLILHTPGWTQEAFICVTRSQPYATFITGLAARDRKGFLFQGSLRYNNTPQSQQSS